MTAVQSIMTTAVVPYRTKISEYRKPATVNWMLMEERLRQHLEGKFFNVSGEDLFEEEREEQRAQWRARAAREAKKKAAEEQLKRKVEAQRKAHEALLKERSKYAGYTVSMIIEAICHAHQVGGGELVGTSRRKQVVKARQHACVLMISLLKMSNTAAGKVLGRDHSTVIHACAQWETTKNICTSQIASVNKVLGLAE